MDIRENEWVGFAYGGMYPQKRKGIYPIGSMYAIYGNIYHQYSPNVSIYTIHGSYGYCKTTVIWRYGQVK
jgi:hypothetical protein